MKTFAKNAKSDKIKKEDDVKIEFKKVKHCKWASEETPCFRAEIWVNGDMAGIVKNDGQGGANIYEMQNRELLKKAEAYCKTLPPMISDGLELPMDLELYTLIKI
jgi:hypothetical protein